MATNPGHDQHEHTDVGYGEQLELFWKRRGELAVMLGEQDAVVMEVRPFPLHGVTYYDVAVRFSDQTVEQARLGPEGVPGGLHPGEQVLATRVGTMVVSLRRP